VDQGELIRAAQQGEREAFDELVRQTYVEVFTLACRLTGNEEDARDVAQDAYLRAWRGIGRFRGEAQFSTWMYRITANAAATHTHRRRRQRTEQLDDHPEPVETRLESLPGPAAESAEALDRLSRAISTLPAKLRHVVLLKDVYGLSHEDIAAELDISVAAAKVRLHRARRKLKDMLYESGEEAHAV
jgi:RNA polymerase sigma-70 factor, ECF subfamily